MDGISCGSGTLIYPRSAPRTSQTAFDTGSKTCIAISATSSKNLTFSNLETAGLNSLEITIEILSFLHRRR